MGFHVLAKIQVNTVTEMENLIRSNALNIKPPLLINHAHCVVRVFAKELLMKPKGAHKVCHKSNLRYPVLEHVDHFDVLLCIHISSTEYRFSWLEAVVKAIHT
jgi:hypothetical protein